MDVVTFETGTIVDVILSVDEVSVVGGDGVILVVTVDSAPAFPISDVVVEVDKVVLLEGSVDCVKASDDAISRSSCFSADDIIDNVEVMLGIPALVKSICWAPADVDINSSVVDPIANCTTWKRDFTN